MNSISDRVSACKGQHRESSVVKEGWRLVFHGPVCLPTGKCTCGMRFHWIDPEGKLHQEYKDDARQAIIDFYQKQI